MSGRYELSVTMTMDIKASRDVIIRTDNFDEAIKFYRHVLGLAVAYKSETLYGFDAGSFRLYVERGPRHGPVFDFLVADFQAAKQALLAAGCTIDEEDRSVPRCYIRDPQGLVFNIEQRRAEK
jgi:catechol 2,3-dioxygenase-like lactoylglutathione lyase family enzyme